MVIALPTAVFLVFSTFYADLAYSQCILGKPIKDKEFPDLSQIVSHRYTTTVAVNFPSLKKTVLSTEYYDITNGKGRVDLLEEGQAKQFLYFHSTNEAFTISGLKCETKYLNDFTIPFGSKTVYDWNYKVNNITVLGPSAMFWNALDRYKIGKVNYMGEDRSGSIRGITAEYWRGCLNDESLVVDYYFAVKEWQSEYGPYQVNIPLRIEVQGEESIGGQEYVDQIYEFVQFEPNVRNTRTIFGIPSGYGCTRLVADLPVAPVFEGFDKSYGAELRYTEADDDHVYITNVYYVEDAETDHRGYYYSTWDKIGKNGVRSAKDYRFIVYNQPTGYLYNITKDKAACTVKRVDNFDEGIPLPGEISANLKNDLITGDDSKDIYLGQSKRRGLLCDVFEETKYLYGDESTEEFASVMATRYYLSESEEYETSSHETNAPLQVLMRIIDSRSKTNAELVINIFGFSTRLNEKNKLFNIEECFPKSSQSKLLHLTFEVSDKDITRSIAGLIPTIKEQVLGLLLDKASLMPIRIPEILIDFDTTGMHAFANVLERPDFLLDFESSGHYTFENAEETIGMSTKTQCAKLCLERAGFCRGFSHCGSTCYIVMSPSSANKTKASEKCHLYKRLGSVSDVRIKTTDEALGDLSAVVNEKELPIFDDATSKPHILVNWINVKGEEEETLIPLSKVEVSSGDVNNMENSKLPGFDYHFDEHKYGAKLKKGAAHVKSHGGIPYQECQQICLNDLGCQSLSSCMPVPECLTSHKYGDELKEDDIVGNSKCIVVARKYVDAFVEYPGLMIVTKAGKEIDTADQEECAKACLNADDLPCRSFDFCPRAKNKKVRCLLQSVHFLDVKTQTSEIAVNETGFCGHYSRNYIRDFKVVKGKTVPTGGSSKFLKFTGITEEQCAIKCVQNGAFTCNSFDHCDGTEMYRSTCYLHSKKEEDNLINSPVCNNYIRQYYAKGEDKLTYARRQKRFGSGTVAGLSIFFFLIGCGLGIVVIFAHAWYTGKRL